ncbi:MAG: hypothetical protein JWN01_294 [Patescibacteria group bacterium]|nr:hypothetical protein [Patescibacteria group bacterium]
MFVFIIANLPLPIIMFLNLRVTLKFLKVRHLSRNMPIDKPERLVIGWWLNNLAMIFIYTPMLWERRIFVQNHWWVVSYMIAATLSITGLLLMNSGLSEELKVLARRKRKPRKA